MSSSFILFWLIGNTATERNPQPALLQLFVWESVTPRPCDRLRADILVPSATQRTPGTQEGGKKCLPQCFSNWRVLQSHPWRACQNTDCWALPPRLQTQDLWAGAWEPAFLISSRGLLGLLAHVHYTLKTSGLKIQGFEAQIIYLWGSSSPSPPTYLATTG